MDGIIAELEELLATVEADIEVIEQTKSHPEMQGELESIRLQLKRDIRELTNAKEEIAFAMRPIQRLGNTLEDFTNGKFY